MAFFIRILFTTVVQREISGLLSDFSSLMKDDKKVKLVGFWLMIVGDLLMLQVI